MICKLINSSAALRGPQSSRLSLKDQGYLHQNKHILYITYTFVYWHENNIPYCLRREPMLLEIN